jgi:hypothetical protein
VVTLINSQLSYLVAEIEFSPIHLSCTELHATKRKKKKKLESLYAAINKSQSLSAPNPHLSLFQSNPENSAFLFLSPLISPQAATKDLWCSRPDNLKMISIEHWRNMTQPSGHCSMIDAPYESLDAFNFTQHLANATATALVKCSAWEFDMSFIGKTIVSEWNMVCDKGYLASVVESCFLAGKKELTKIL